MALRTASLALLIAPFSAPASAETFWPDHASFALKLRISLSVRPVSPASMQRPARIYAMELAPSPASPADLRLSMQRRRQRFQSTRMARLALLPGADVRPRHGSIPRPDVRRRHALVGMLPSCCSNSALSA
ncbi:hypothetical protein [Sphingobium sp.]|uniref:hypothetical protein n=1 Tax=Sphingobium sp. TaxID=1912891 RepID=UPI003B3ABEBE